MVEVSHRMSDRLATWGELCDKAGIEAGDTPREAPVTRMATGGNPITATGFGGDFAPACSTGSCCPGGMCGID
jgi:hypothetical protein